MKYLSRVVWAEGMYLSPLHFQAQSRYFEDSIRFVAESFTPGAYGVAGLALDEEALGNGTVSIVHARGIMPDGVAFDMPESDATPEPRNISSVIPPATDRITILLAIPARKTDGLNCSLSPNGTRDRYRYLAEMQVLHDETTGRDEKNVQIGRKNLRVILETEVTDDLITLPIARVMRSGSGKFVLDPAFVPPCVQVGASQRLMKVLGRLIEIMEDKVAALSREAEAAGGAASFSTREIASFWFLHTVNSSLTPLRHLYLSKRGHPSELYIELARLAGALCTFTLNSHPRDLPDYDHRDPGPGFDALDRQIREHLDLIVPVNCLTIPLRSTGDYFYAGDVQDSRCFARSNWFLAVRAEMGDVEVISQVPSLVKICSAKFVGELVRRALPGLDLVHVPVPPPAISARVGTHYFMVSKNGPFWDHIVNTRQVGVYVPGDIPQPEIQMLAVLDI